MGINCDGKTFYTSARTVGTREGSVRQLSEGHLLLSRTTGRDAVADEHQTGVLSAQFPLPPPFFKRLMVPQRWGQFPFLCTITMPQCSEIDLKMHFLLLLLPPPPLPPSKVY